MGEENLTHSFLRWKHHSAFRTYSDDSAITHISNHPAVSVPFTNFTVVLNYTRFTVCTEQIRNGL